MHTMQPKCMRIQTSGIFKFPLELLLEIFSYFTDHRRFIRENYYGRAGDSHLHFERRFAERSAVIRRLTMTCWPLRNSLLPLLWTDVEGCVSHTRYYYGTNTGSSGSNLYAQCVYLTLNPVVATHVRTFSISLWFAHSPDDLMKKLVDCLVRLPNLKTLEVLSVSSRAPISKVLKRKYASFPNIRELRITHACHHFIRNCPNLEDLTFTDGLDVHSRATILSHGKGLKRVAGVGVIHTGGLHAVGWGCPNVREICIVMSSDLVDNGPVGELRQLKHLAVVDVDIKKAASYELSGDVCQESVRKVWKRRFVDLLKDSPSAERKFLRWRITQRRLGCGHDRAYDVVQDEELEVLPETSS